MIHLVVALPAEARPLIDFYRLRRTQEDSLFPVWRADDVSLVVSGIGSRASAAATAYLFSRTGEPNHSVWCNAGVAGHRERALGEAVIAHRVTEQSTGRNWYPPQAIRHGIITDSLVTVDRPHTDYDLRGLIDMEAAGFCLMASRCTTSELAQCFKVISDNQQHPASAFSPEQAVELLAENLPTLNVFLQNLKQLSRELSAQHHRPDTVPRFTERWHFTVTQARRLERLLDRWRALTGDDFPMDPALASLQRSQEVLDEMERRIDALPVHFSADPDR